MCCLIEIFICLQITNNYLYIESIYYKFTFDETNYKNKKSCIISHKTVIPERMDDNNEVYL